MAPLLRPRNSARGTIKRIATRALMGMEMAWILLTLSLVLGGKLLSNLLARTVRFLAQKQHEGKPSSGAKPD